MTAYTCDLITETMQFIWAEITQRVSIKEHLHKSQGRVTGILIYSTSQIS